MSSLTQLLPWDQSNDIFPAALHCPAGDSECNYTLHTRLSSSLHITTASVSVHECVLSFNCSSAYVLLGFNLTFHRQTDINQINCSYFYTLKNKVESELNNMWNGIKCNMNMRKCFFLSIFVKNVLFYCSIVNHIIIIICII